MFKIDTCINLEKVSMSKFSPFLLQKCQHPCFVTWICMLPIRKSSWVGRGPVRWAPTPKRVLQPLWVLFDFLAGNSALHNVRGFCRNDGSWLGTMLAPHLTGFLLGCELQRCLSGMAPHQPTQKTTHTAVCVGMQKQYV